MISKELQRAREYVAENSAAVAADLPRFHLTGGIGWINDPNGVAPYRGEYHVFYQYYPYDTKWGPMHWGHAKTRDFIHWQQLPAALAPDQEYDKDGVFSGGAVEMPDGRHLLMYTGVREARRADGSPTLLQTQCIAFGDGENYEKYEGNPVITGEQLPAGSDIFDFRDPHIWREDGMYYVVLGNRAQDGSGAILLYKSRDAIHWEFVNTVAFNHHQYGKMWECPDLFRLDGKDVLFISPESTTAIGYEFHAGHSSLCMIGTLDPETGILTREHEQAVDYGLDFYAMQTLQASDGRRIMIGWMQNWATANAQLPGQRFVGQMTLPRELAIRNGRLTQNPVRELETCRRNRVSYADVLLTGESTLQGIQGRFIDMTVTVRPVPEESVYRRFQIRLAMGGGRYTEISYTPENNLLHIDRSQSGLPFDIVNTREVPVFAHKGELKLRIVMDRYSIELFVNDGEQAASSVIYTPMDAEEIRFSCEGSARMDVEKYDLEI